MRRTLPAAAVVAAVVLAGCGTSDSPGTSPGADPDSNGTPSSAAPSSSSAAPSESASPSESPSDEADPEAIEIEIEGGDIEPKGRRVEVSAGETITFAVESDREASLHVHSSPEQVLEVKPGRSTLTLVIDRPGVVDVEEHDTGLVVVQLEVR